MGIGYCCCSWVARGETADDLSFYVHMAVAWALATAFLRDAEAVLSILRSGELNEETQKMTIRKLLDSRRVDQVYREEIKAIQRK